MISHNESCGICHQSMCTCNTLDNAPMSYLNELRHWPSWQVQKHVVETSLDRFHSMWKSQEDFMRLLHEKRGLPEFPVDLTSKSGQKVIKEAIRDCADELFEATLVCKNAKNHRAMEFKEFDREHFVEELVDATKFILEAAVFAGINEDEFVNAFTKKTSVNEARINEGY